MMMLITWSIKWTTIRNYLSLARLAPITRIAVAIAARVAYAAARAIGGALAPLVPRPEFGAEQRIK